MTFVNKTETTIMCEASHLTNFAILINPSNTIVSFVCSITFTIQESGIKHNLYFWKHQEEYPILYFSIEWFWFSSSTIILNFLLIAFVFYSHNVSSHQFTGSQELALQIITIAGCTLSIIGLLATIIGLAVFKWVPDTRLVLIHNYVLSFLLKNYILGPWFSLWLVSKTLVRV